MAATNNLLRRSIQQLPAGATVIDFGCLHWQVARIAISLGRADLNVTGCDLVEPAGRPSKVRFVRAHPESNRVRLPNNTADLMVASHVIEHVHKPVQLIGELLRMTKPDGLLYMETPSDRMALTKSYENVETHAFRSFWDDPTHIRPYTPAALYRLAISFSCRPIECSYGGAEERWAKKGWLSQILARKPQVKGRPKYVYISLRDTGPGVEAALDLWRDSNGSG